jgi:hypothetical protein
MGSARNQRQSQQQQPGAPAAGAVSASADTGRLTYFHVPPICLTRGSPVRDPHKQVARAARIAAEKAVHSLCFDVSTGQSGYRCNVPCKWAGTSDPQRVSTAPSALRM